MTTPAPRSPRRLARCGKYADDGGFTLVETMVSVALLAIVAAGATTGIVAGTQAQSATQARTVAANLARSDLDVARAVAYPAYPSPVSATPTAVGNQMFTVQRSISAPGGAAPSCPTVISASGVRELFVTTTVTWAGGRRSVSMSTVISC